MIINKNSIFNRYFIYIILIFIISRLFLSFILGIDMNDLNYGYKLLDYPNLENSFLSSIIYLHSQTPGWNLLNAISFKIFSGNLTIIYLTFNILFSLLTFFIIYYAILICREFDLSIKGEIIIISFLLLNPTIIFYENLFDYNQVITFLFTQMSYFIIKFFKSNEKKFEILTYVNLLFLSYFWALFQPVLILLVFIIFRFFDREYFKNIFVIFIIISFSLIPSIKNKIVFDVFTSSSKSGVDFSTIFPDWLDNCVSSEINNDQEFITYNNIEKYFPYYEKIYLNEIKQISNELIVGNSSKHNNVAYFILGKKCQAHAISKIFDNPSYYVSDRFKTFLASHGKFGFDFMSAEPKNWNKYYGTFKQSYKISEIKLTKQLIIFILCMFIYFILLKFMFFTKKNNSLRKALFIIGLIYFYLLTICTLGAGTEQERYLYTGFVINIFFMIIILKKILKN